MTEVEIPKPPRVLTPKEQQQYEEMALTLLQELWTEPVEQGFFERLAPYLLLFFDVVLLLVLLLRK